MHELSIAKSIIAITEKSLPKDFDKKVLSVNLQIGILSGIEIDALTYSYSIISAKTILAGSTLKIERIVGKAVCNSCGNTFEINSYGSVCTNCNSFSLKIIQGKELKVTHVEVID